jgi:predicted DNA-binding protein with PD1-like motif
MEYTEGRIGRIFWVKIEHGDDPRAGLLELARRERIEHAAIWVLGALEKGRMVAGPETAALPPRPMWTAWDDGREILGLGTLAPGDDGPEPHLHLAAGRRGESAEIGCLRGDNQAYVLVEAVVMEISGVDARRGVDPAIGLPVLTFGG